MICSVVDLPLLTPNGKCVPHQTVYAVDQVPDRLEEAKRHGADAVFHLTEEDVPAEIKTLTENRGADVVLEVVGVEPALHLAVNCIRNYGVISSCGIHNKPVTLKGLDLYSRYMMLNVSAQSQCADDVKPYCSFLAWQCRQEHPLPVRTTREP